jgi:hypothetical protein
MLGNKRNRESREKIYNNSPVCKVPTRQLTDNQWMAPHLILHEEHRQSVGALPQVIHPDRSVHESHHLDAGRRRRIAFNCNSLPPRSANRRAEARAISASSPSRTNSVFSATPVRRVARFTNSSSMFNVVRICLSMHHPRMRGKQQSGGHALRLGSIESTSHTAGNRLSRA